MGWRVDVNPPSDVASVECTHARTHAHAHTYHTTQTCEQRPLSSNRKQRTQQHRSSSAPPPPRTYARQKQTLPHSLGRLHMCARARTHARTRDSRQAWYHGQLKEDERHDEDHDEVERRLCHRGKRVQVDCAKTGSRTARAAQPEHAPAVVSASTGNPTRQTTRKHNTQSKGVGVGAVPRSRAELRHCHQEVATRKGRSTLCIRRTPPRPPPPPSSLSRPHPSCTRASHRRCSARSTPPQVPRPT